MKAKQSVEAQARSILQKVHNDACKKNHLPELGYSERAYDLVMELIAQAKQEALSTLKAQVRKEIEEQITKMENSNWLHGMGLSGSQAEYIEANIKASYRSIPSLKEEE